MILTDLPHKLSNNKKEPYWFSFTSENGICSEVIGLAHSGHLYFAPFYAKPSTYYTSGHTMPPKTPH